MSQNFLSAHLNPVTWQPTGRAAATLNVTNHNLKIMATLFDVSNSGSQGRTARIAGKKDTSGTIEADYDQDSSPYLAAPDIDAGVPGIMLFFLTPTRAIQAPQIIEGVNYQTGGQNTQVKYSFDVKENALAGQFIYPAL